MKVLGKGFRLAIFLVVFIVAFVLFAFVVAARGDDFSKDYSDIMMAGSSCFVGSAFFVLAYDTFYKDRDGKKGFLQKVFTLIGFIFTAVFGIVAQVLYYQNFEVSQNYSPFLFALGAPWLMSGLLTLFLFEVKFKNSNGLLKIALPFISLIVCYILYVILGFAGRSSAFVYAGIGSVICAILAFVLLVILKVLGKNSKPTNSESSADGSYNEEDYLANESYLQKYFEDGIKSYVAKGFHSINGETPFSSEVYVVFDYSDIMKREHDECKVDVRLYVNMEKLRECCMGCHNEPDLQKEKKSVEDMQYKIKKVFHKLIEDLPQGFGKYSYSLTLNTIKK